MDCEELRVYRPTERDFPFIDSATRDEVVQCKAIREVIETVANDEGGARAFLDDPKTPLRDYHSCYEVKRHSELWQACFNRHI